MDDVIHRITDNVRLREKRAQRPVVANVSNRHIHLLASDMEQIFGSGYKLTKIKDLMQPGEHACKETVTIRGSRGEIKNVRVLGPLRKSTQVEVSLTDTFVLGVKAPVRVSGDTAGSSPITVIGPAGTVELKEGCVVAKRHVHMTAADAEFYGLANGDIISVRVGGDRGLVFGNTVARVSDKMALEFHVDTDEANAAGIKNGDMAVIL